LRSVVVTTSHMHRSSNLTNTTRMAATNQHSLTSLTNSKTICQ
jgi:hypothetical protein